MNLKSSNLSSDNLLSLVRFLMYIFNFHKCQLLFRDFIHIELNYLHVMNEEHESSIIVKIFTSLSLLRLFHRHCRWQGDSSHLVEHLKHS